MASERDDSSPDNILSLSGGADIDALSAGFAAIAHEGIRSVANNFLRNVREVNDLLALPFYLLDFSAAESLKVALTAPAMVNTSYYRAERTAATEAAFREEHRRLFDLEMKKDKA